MKKIIISVFCILSMVTFAQETEIFEADGITGITNAQVIKKGRFLVQSQFGYSEHNIAGTPGWWGTFDQKFVSSNYAANIRYGLTESFELNAGYNYVGTDRFVNSFEANSNDLSFASIGIRQQLLKKSELQTKLTLFGNVMLPVGYHSSQTKSVIPQIGISNFQRLSKRWSYTVNLALSSNFPFEPKGVLTLYRFSERTRLDLDAQINFNVTDKFQLITGLDGIGASYQILDNLLVQGYTRLLPVNNIKGVSDFGVSGGLSWRIGNKSK